MTSVYTVPRAGIDSWCLYGAETTYGTAATTIATHFGIVQSVSPSSRRNLVQVRGFVGSTTSGRNMIKALGGKFETGQELRETLVGGFRAGEAKFERTQEQLAGIAEEKRITTGWRD